MPAPEPKANTKGVPRSSERNTRATSRTVAVIAIVVAFLLIAVMVPW